MRLVAAGILVVMGVVGGYSALGQQNSQSRLASEAVKPTLVAQAQTQPDVTTTVETPEPVEAPAAVPAPVEVQAPASQPETPAVDETALRYFARQGDTARMQAEIERLRSLHPGWEPPTNLLSDDYTPDTDIERIWDLFSAGDFAAARAAIAAKQAADPSFVPSDDLLASLARGEAGLRLRTASDAKQYETVIAVAANQPDLLTCDAIDNLWRLGEAFARTANIPRALDAYSYILANCTDTALRYATMQKAIDLLDRADLAPLFALEQTDAAGEGEFAALKLDLARRAIATALDDDSRPLAEDIALFEKSAEDSQDAADLRLMGWYELGRDRPDTAQSWFERAMSADPSTESAQGLGASLLNLGDPQAAEGVLYEYRSDNDEIRGLYLDASAALLALQPRIDLDARVLSRIADTVAEARHPMAAQELGWYAYDFQQPQTAIQWFTLALRWKTDLEPAAFGLMVASNALGDLATVESIRAQWGARSERIASFGRTTTSAAGSTIMSASGSTMTAVGTPPLPRARPLHAATMASAAPVQTRPAQPRPAQTSQASTSAPQTSSGARGCSVYVPPGSLSAGAALSHAWCLMDLNRPAQAVEHFSRALQASAERTRIDAAYGLSLAYIRLGLADEAAVAAAAAPISDRQALELEIAILSRKAVSAYEIGDYRRALDALDARARYAPERNDLLTLRAWSYYHLRRFAESKRIFEAVAATGYGDAVAGLEAAKSALAIAAQ